MTSFLDKSRSSELYARIESSVGGVFCVFGLLWFSFSGCGPPYGIHCHLLWRGVLLPSPLHYIPSLDLFVFPG